MYSNCGTYAGYRKHHNNKTQPCLECLIANREYSKIRYAKNGRERQANSRARNLDKVRERERSKNRKRKAITGIPYSESTVISIYGTNCYLCKFPIDLSAPRKTGVEGWEMGLHIDHVVPISKGGIDGLQNVRPTHGICNLKKMGKLRILTHSARVEHGGVCLFYLPPNFKSIFALDLYRRN